MKNILSWLGFLVEMQLAAQTIPAPKLACVNNDAINASVSLQWSSSGNPCGGAFNGYKIYVSNTISGTYTLVTTVTNESQTTFIDAGRLSQGSKWYYYIEADYDCPGFQILQSDTIENAPPATPEIVSVDVTANNQIVINWKQSISPQTCKYVLYYALPNGNAQPFDTVLGRSTVSAIDPVADPTISSVAYTLAASDCCNKISSFNTKPQRTMFLTYTTSQCERSINLKWTRYENWNLGVKEYRVLVSKNLQPFEVVATVDTAAQVFSFSGFSDGDSLCISIVAVNAEDTNIISHSNYACFVPSIVQSPDYLYPINATVNLDNSVTTKWLVDPKAELLFYQIDIGNNGSEFTLLKQYTVPSPLNQIETYIDSSSNPSANALFYRVKAIDSCNNKFPSTDSIKTVNLTGELLDYYVTGLNWNNFAARYTSILYWNLYRNFGAGGFQFLKRLPAGVNESADSLQAFLSEKGKFCYRIEAVYEIDIPGLYKDTLSSFSNVFCIDHRPIIYIPNAFVPNGVNNVFKPTIIFGSPSNYSMTIWNRWGAKIFESNTPDIGWDGTQDGRDVQMGAYAYLIKFVASDGVNIERKGMVMLVK
jgi:gliding motility-associated-like protein